MPSKLEIVDDIWGEKTNLPKRKQQSQNPEVRRAEDGDRDTGQATNKRCKTSGLVENQPTSSQKSPQETALLEANSLKGKPGPGEIRKAKTWADL